jgi:hypothetical protein
MSSIVVETPPAAEPVTLILVKNHLRVTISSDDQLIDLYLQSSREIVESESGRSLVNKLYKQSHDRFPHRDEWQLGSGYSYRAPRYSHHFGDERQAIKLLRCPLVSVSKITYIDTSGTLQTLLPTPEQWQAQTEYEIGNQIVDSNGNLQEVTAVSESGEDGSSESGATVPAWAASINATTADAALTWTNKRVAPTGDFLEDRDSEPPRLMPLWGNIWPLTQRVPNAVKIYFTAGYGNDAATAPAALKVAVMMATGVCYQNREAVTPEDLRALDWYERLIWANRVLDWNPTK